MSANDDMTGAATGKLLDPRGRQIRGQLKLADRVNLERLRTGPGDPGRLPASTTAGLAFRSRRPARRPARSGRRHTIARPSC